MGILILALRRGPSTDPGHELRLREQENPARRLHRRRPQGTDLRNGFANLTNAETTMLVHFGQDRTQQWSLIRLEQPAEQK